MRIRILPSAPAAPAECQYLTSFLIDDVVAVDAGCLGLYGTPDEQAKVRDVFLTHSHADHTGSLPIFIENAYERRPDCVVVHGHAATLDSLGRDVFNGRVWPDLLGLREEGQAIMRLSELEAESGAEAAGLRITPIAMDHTVATFGYLIEDSEGAVLIAGDTSPTTRLWEVARATPKLRAVFLESSFPDRLEEFALKTGHLTPRSFSAELRKLDRDIPVIAVHIKARQREETVEELLALDGPEIRIGEGGREYEF